MFNNGGEINNWPNYPHLLFCYGLVVVEIYHNSICVYFGKSFMSMISSQLLITSHIAYRMLEP